jgi:hypothetical protein
MARLTQKQRDALPSSAFAGEQRSYPVPDRGHAINAKGRAKQQLESGRLTHAQYERIVADANRVLGK